MSSMISYFSDRILTPEMMRAMIILYIGPHHRPDFSTDYLLSPLLAPEHLLARFPRVWFLTGERDPLVDDTVIFAGRLRQAKRSAWAEARELGLPFGLAKPNQNQGGGGRQTYSYEKSFREEDHVNVDLVPGTSHGFLQFVGVFPEGWTYIRRCGKWMVDAFKGAEHHEDSKLEAQASGAGGIGRRREGSGYFGAQGLEGMVSSLAASKRGTGGRHHFRSGTQSSADDDRPLEMTVRSSVSKPKPSPPTDSTGQPNGQAEANSTGKTRERKNSRANGYERGRGKGRRRSLVSLASEDDLLGRRMKGLTGGLMGGWTTAGVEGGA
jgi:hypothetical protein